MAWLCITASWLIISVHRCVRRDTRRHRRRKCVFVQSSMGATDRRCESTPPSPRSQRVEAGSAGGSRGSSAPSSPRPMARRAGHIPRTQRSYYTRQSLVVRRCARFSRSPSLGESMTELDLHSRFTKTRPNLYGQTVMGDPIRGREEGKLDASRFQAVGYGAICTIYGPSRLLTFGGTNRFTTTRAPPPQCALSLTCVRLRGRNIVPADRDRARRSGWPSRPPSRRSLPLRSAGRKRARGLR